MTATAWIAIGFTAAGWVIGLAVQWGYNKNWFQTMSDTVKRYAEHHVKHFEAIAHLETANRENAKQLAGHEQLDDERFYRIEALLKESRDDIKQILRSLSEHAK